MALFSRRRRTVDEETSRQMPALADAAPDDVLRTIEDLFTPVVVGPGDASVRAVRHVAIGATEIGLPALSVHATTTEPPRRRRAERIGAVLPEPGDSPLARAPEASAPEASTPEASAPETSAPEIPAPEIPDPERGSSLSVIGALQERERMANLEQSVQELLTIDGATGAALVDAASGMALAQGGHPGFDLGIAAAGNSNVVRAKLQTMKDLGLSGRIDDILITLDEQYHLINVLNGGATGGLFVYLVLDRAKANLALARHKLSGIAGQIEV